MHKLTIPSFPNLLAFDTYQRVAYEYALYPQEKIIEYPTLGLTEEAGETAGKVKRIYRDDGGVLTPERKNQIVKELGDTLWYLAAIATDIGVPLSDVAYTNLLKLHDRKERDMLHGEGDNR